MLKNPFQVTFDELNEVSSGSLKLAEPPSSSQSDLKKHVLSSINDRKKPFKCIICDISYAYKKDLNDHKAAAHEIAMPYSCANCNSGFFRKQELLEHVLSSHDGKGAEVYQITEGLDSENNLELR